jgi:hypothetical protein
VADSEGREDLPDDRWIVERGDQAQPALRNVGTPGHQMRISKLNSTDLFAGK